MLVDREKEWDNYKMDNYNIYLKMWEIVIIMKFNRKKKVLIKKEIKIDKFENEVVIF